MGRWAAHWDTFKTITEERLAGIDENQNVDGLNETVCVRILEAAPDSVPKTSGR